MRSPRMAPFVATLLALAALGGVRAEEEQDVILTSLENVPIDSGTLQILNDGEEVHLLKGEEHRARREVGPITVTQHVPEGSTLQSGQEIVIKFNIPSPAEPVLVYLFEGAAVKTVFVTDSYPTTTGEIRWKIPRTIPSGTYWIGLVSLSYRFKATSPTQYYSWGNNVFNIQQVLCSSHDMCSDSEYCDINGDCFPCSDCKNIRDAFDGVCPQKCGFTNMLVPGERLPDVDETEASGPLADFARPGCRSYDALSLAEANDYLVFANPVDQTSFLTSNIQEKLYRLSGLVRNRFQGNAKLVVTKGFVGETPDLVPTDSLHHVGRAVDITIDVVQNLPDNEPEKIKVLGELAVMASDAGFDWVWFQDTTPLSVYASVIDETCKTGLDIVFVLDASGSIEMPGYGGNPYTFADEVRPFVKSVVDYFDIGPNNDDTRVGVMTFATGVNINFLLKDYFDKAEMMEAIDSIPYTRGGTQTSLALDVAREVMFNELNGMRPGHMGKPRICVVVTDGNANDGYFPATAAEQLREQGVTVFAIAVGKGVKQSEMESIASQPYDKYLRPLKSFEYAASIVASMSSTTCAVPALVDTGFPTIDTVGACEAKYYAPTCKKLSNVVVDLTLLEGDIPPNLYIDYGNPNPSRLLNTISDTRDIDHKVHRVIRLEGQTDQVFVTVQGEAYTKYELNIYTDMFPGQTLQTYTFAEGPVGGTLPRLIFDAPDMDVLGPGLNDLTVQYFLAEGDTYYFSVDPNNGDLYQIAEFDREDTGFHKVVILAQDAEFRCLTGRLVVHVTVTDINDNAPTFQLPQYAFAVPETTPVNTVVQQFVEASDPDLGDNGDVTITCHTSQVPFERKPDGTIIVTGSLDAETKSQYTFTCTATDNGNPSLSTTVTVQATVTAVDCPTGKFSTTGTYPCTPCPSNQYADQAGSTSCTSCSCPSGQYSTQTCSATVSPGCQNCVGQATSPSGSTSPQACTCLTGYYNPFRTLGSGQDGCVAQCLTSCPSGEYLVGTCSTTSRTSCVACKTVQQCATGPQDTTQYYLTGTCGGTTDYTCATCSGPCGDHEYLHAACSTMADRVCHPCDASCSRCTGPSDSDCFACDTGEVLFQGSCLSECPEGYFEDGLGSCQECSNDCATCTQQASTCTSCDSPRVLYQGVCQDECPPGFFADAAGLCQQCSACQAPTFASGGCIGSQDTECTPWTQCSLGDRTEYVGALGTATTDTQCLPCVLACPAGEQLTAAGCSISDPQTNRACESCPAGTYQLGNPSAWPCQACDCPSGQFVASCSPTNGPTCEVCKTEQDCPAGQYLAGQCGGTSSTSCEDCTVCPQNFYFSTQCGTGSPGICSQCPQSCQPGFYLDGTCGGIHSTFCTPCNVASDCQVGFYLAGDSCDGAPGNKQVCEPCPDNCDSCHVIDTELLCTQCSANFFLHNGECVQTCPTGTYPHANGNCVACPASNGCATCGAPNGNCVTCPANRFHNGNGACVADCGTGRYGNTQTGQCQACTPCGEDQFLASGCIGASDSVCAQVSPPCATGQYEAAEPTDTSDRQCVTCLVETDCNGDEYLSGTCGTSEGPICVGCDDQCGECSGSATTCTGCNEGQLLEEATCVTQCSVGYYQSGTNCVACEDDACASCTGAGTGQCTACDANKVLYNGECVDACPSGTFNDNSVCKDCIAGCDVCSSTTTCTTCEQGQFLASNGQACVSSTGCGTNEFANTATGQCETCTACADNGQYRAGGCAGTANSDCQPLDVCTQGEQYESTAPSETQNRQCTDCLTANDCASNEFLSDDACGPTSGPTCVTCHTRCASCTGALVSQCTSCATNFFLQGTTCQSSCNVGFYADASRVCQACADTNCDVCSASSSGSVCVECTDTFFLDGTVCVAECSTTQFAKTVGGVATCQACPASNDCATCEDETGKCLTCAAGKFINAAGQCVSNCGAGKFGNTETGQCASCTACESTQYLSTGCDGVVDSVCLDVSPPCTAGQEYQSAAPTANSDRVCVTCLTQNDCASNEFLTGSCGATSGPTCQPCSPSCGTCSGSSTTCTGCAQGELLQGNECVSTCGSGFYQSGTNCVACEDSNCVLCSGAGTGKCTTCDANKVLYNGQCVDACPSGTFNDNSVCKDCIAGCDVCSSTTTCTTCEQGQFLASNGQACVSSTGCGTNEFANTATGQCETCTACADNGQYRAGGCAGTANSDCQPLDVCTQGEQYESTAPSETQNRQCTDCLTANDCASNEFLSDDACGPTSGPTCVTCHTRCASCTGALVSQCTSCATNFFLQGTTCQSSCNVGFYADASRACQACADTNCDVCSASSSGSVCVECTDTFFLDGTVCVAECSTTQFAKTVGGVATCQACPASNDCATCEDETGKCLTCAAGKFINAAGQCVSNCGAGKFGNTETGQCASCTACESTQYLSTGCDGVVDSVCLDVSPPCTAGQEYQSAAPTANSDRVCVTCLTQNDCAINQFLSGACGATSGPTCQPCSPSCGTCSGSSTTCTGCAQGELLQGNECVSTCGSGFYQSGTSCLPCGDASCAVCSGAGTGKCTTCDSGKLLSNGQCVDTCPSGTYNNNGVCTACSTCASGFFADGGCAGTQNTLCTEWTECESTEYEAASPTSISNRVCETCTTIEDCQPSQFLSGTCSGQTNPTCEDCDSCGDGEFEISACTDFADTECGTCLTPNDCQSNAFLEGTCPDGVGGPPVCTPVTICDEETQYISVPASPVSDALCVPQPSGRTLPRPTLSTSGKFGIAVTQYADSGDSAQATFTIEQANNLAPGSTFTTTATIASATATTTGTVPRQAAASVECVPMFSSPLSELRTARVACQVRDAHSNWQTLATEVSLTATPDSSGLLPAAETACTTDIATGMCTATFDLPAAWFRGSNPVAVSFGYSVAGSTGGSFGPVSLVVRAPTSSVTANEVVVELPTQDPLPGDSFAIPVRLVHPGSNTLPVGSYALRVTVDGTVVQLVSVDVPVAYASSTKINGNVGVAFAFFTDLTSSPAVASGDVLVTVRVSIASSASASDTGSVAVDLVQLFSAGGEPLAVGGGAGPAGAAVYQASADGSLTTSGAVTVGDSTEVVSLLGRAELGHVFNLVPVTGIQTNFGVTLYAATSAGTLSEVQTGVTCSSSHSSTVEFTSAGSGCSTVALGGPVPTGGGAPTVALTLGAHGLTTTVPLSVWHIDPTTLVVSLNKSELAPLKGLGSVTCNAYQQARIKVKARFTDGDASSDLLDVTGLVSTQLASSAPTVATVSGNTVVGVSPGSAQVQVLRLGQPLVETAVQVTSTAVRVTRLDLAPIAGFGIAVNGQATTAVADFSTTLTSRTTYKVHASILTADGHKMDVTTSSGLVLASSNTNVMGTVGQAVTVRNAGQARLLGTFKCGTNAVVQSSTKVTIDVVEAATAAVSIKGNSGTTLTLAGNPAATAGVPVSLPLKVVVRDAQGNEEDVTSSVSTLYSSADGLSVSLTTGGVFVSADAGTSLGPKTLNVAFAHNTLTASLTVTVVTAASVRTTVSQHPPFAGSQTSVSSVTLGAYALSAQATEPQFQRASASAHVVLSDGSVRDVTHHVTFGVSGGSSGSLLATSSAGLGLPAVLRVSSSNPPTSSSQFTVAASFAGLPASGSPATITVDPAATVSVSALGSLTLPTLGGDSATSQGAVDVDVSFDDGSAIAGFFSAPGGAPAVPNLLTVSSSHPSAVAVASSSDSGLLTLSANAATEVTITVAAAAGAGSASATMAANLYPAVGDVDLGEVTGVPLPAVQASVGEQFAVPVRLNAGASGAAVFSVSVDYDASRLSVVGVTAGAALTSAGASLSTSQLSGRVTLSAAAALSGVAEVAVVTFEVTNTAGGQPVGLSAVVGLVVNAMGVTVGAPTPRLAVAGDVSQSFSGGAGRRQRRAVCPAGAKIGDADGDCSFGPNDLVVSANMFVDKLLTGSTAVTGGLLKALDADYNGVWDSRDMVFMNRVLGETQCFVDNVQFTPVTRSSGCRVQVTADVSGRFASCASAATVVFLLQGPSSPAPTGLTDADLAGSQVLTGQALTVVDGSSSTAVVGAWEAASAGSPGTGGVTTFSAVASVPWAGSVAAPVSVLQVHTLSSSSFSSYLHVKPGSTLEPFAATVTTSAGQAVSVARSSAFGPLVAGTNAQASQQCHTLPCGEDEFRNTEATATTDSTCATITECGVDEVETAAPTLTSDRVCEQVDDCASNPCGAHGQCVDGVQSYTCECEPGYFGQQCENADGCQFNPCQNGGLCFPVPGGLEVNCQCRYNPTNLDQRFCGACCSSDATHAACSAAGNIDSSVDPITFAFFFTGFETINGVSYFDRVADTRCQAAVNAPGSQTKQSSIAPVAAAGAVGGIFVVVLLVALLVAVRKRRGYSGLPTARDKHPLDDSSLAVGQVSNPSYGVVAPGTDLLTTYKVVVAYDHLRTNRRCLAATDPVLYSNHVRLGYEPPPPSALGLLRAQTQDFLRGSGPTAGDEAADFVSDAVPDWLIELALDAVLGGGSEERQYEAFYHTISEGSLYYESMDDSLGSVQYEDVSPGAAMYDLGEHTESSFGGGDISYDLAGTGDLRRKESYLEVTEDAEEEEDDPVSYDTDEDDQPTYEDADPEAESPYALASQFGLTPAEDLEGDYALATARDAKAEEEESPYALASSFKAASKEESDYDLASSTHGQDEPDYCFADSVGKSMRHRKGAEEEESAYSYASSPERPSEDADETMYTLASDVSTGSASGASSPQKDEPLYSLGSSSNDHAVDIIYDNAEQDA